MISKKILFILFIFTLTFLSCSTAKIGMVGTRNVDYSATYVKGNQVTDKAQILLILIIPVKFDDFNMIEIIDNVMAKEGYDFMTDVEITSITFPFGLITYSRIEISGIGWKRQDGKYSLNNDSSPIMYKIEKEKNVISYTKLLKQGSEKL